MAGRGQIEPRDTMANPKILTLNKNGEWEIAKDPIHFDRSYTGVGPAFTFAKHLDSALSDSTIYIGLIPCAIGGSGINSWTTNVDTAKAGKNFKNAVARCKLAMNAGTLKGIIWNQGETDCTEKGVVGYQEKLIRVVNGFRTELKDTTLPFIAGKLPPFQEQQPNKEKVLEFNPYVAKINIAIENLKKIVSHYNCVEATETNHIGDHLHLNTTSARLMGHRYAETMIRELNQAR